MAKQKQNADIESQLDALLDSVAREGAAGAAGDAAAAIAPRADLAGTELANDIQDALDEATRGVAAGRAAAATPESDPAAEAQTLDELDAALVAEVDENIVGDFHSLDDVLVESEIEAIPPSDPPPAAEPEPSPVTVAAPTDVPATDEAADLAGNMQSIEDLLDEEFADHDATEPPAAIDDFESDTSPAATDEPAAERRSVEAALDQMLGDDTDTALAASLAAESAAATDDSASGGPLDDADDFELAGDMETVEQASGELPDGALASDESSDATAAAAPVRPAEPKAPPLAPPAPPAKAPAPKAAAKPAPAAPPVTPAAPAPAKAARDRAPAAKPADVAVDADPSLDRSASKLVRTLAIVNAPLLGVSDELRNLVGVIGLATACTGVFLIALGMFGFNAAMLAGIAAAVPAVLLAMRSPISAAIDDEAAAADPVIAEDREPDEPAAKAA